jgi:hypothetical protein
MNENITTKIIGQMDNTIDHTFESANRIYDTESIAPTLNTCGGGGLEPKVIVDKFYAMAMRGRNPENPTDRTVGLPTEQRLEISEHPDICNCITSVGKDCLTLEEKWIKAIILRKDLE